MFYKYISSYTPYQWLFLGVLCLFQLTLCPSSIAIILVGKRAGCLILTLKAPIATAADNFSCDSFINFC